MEMSMSMLVLDTNIMKPLYSWVGREDQQRIAAAGCLGTNYVIKPAFRYLNRDMCSADWRSNPVNTSMAPRRQIHLIPGPCFCLKNRRETRRNLLVGTGDIEIFAYNYCKARISRLSRLLFLPAS